MKVKVNRNTSTVSPRQPGTQTLGMDEFDLEAARDSHAIRRASKMKRNKRLVYEAVGRGVPK